MTIDKFSGQHSFMSNFYFSTVKYKGEVYKTVEHAFQAAKTANDEERKHVQGAGTPGEAKKRGRKVELRSDWEEVKDDVMLELLRIKFSSEDMRDKLLATGTAKLIEGNHWGDQYWGVCRGKGKNRLGQLLMKVRTEVEHFQ